MHADEQVVRTGHGHGGVEFDKAARVAEREETRGADGFHGPEPAPRAAEWKAKRPGEPPAHVQTIVVAAVTQIVLGFRLPDGCWWRDAVAAMNNPSRPFSSPVLDGPDRAPSRAMLYAVGFKKEDFGKPQIGIASTWSQVTPCNVHIDKLAVESANGANAAGGKGIIFNTITISDGIDRKSVV
jgi:hypothetical protein